MVNSLSFTYLKWKGKCRRQALRTSWKFTCFARKAVFQSNPSIFRVGWAILVDVSTSSLSWSLHSFIKTRFCSRFERVSTLNQGSTDFGQCMKFLASEHCETRFMAKELTFFFSFFYSWGAQELWAHNCRLQGGSTLWYKCCLYSGSWWRKSFCLCVQRRIFGQRNCLPR